MVKGLCLVMKEIKNKSIFFALCLISAIFLTAYNNSEETEITNVVRSMITAINKKDAEGYIKTLDDYFIKTTYKNEDFIRKNIKNFGQVDLLEFQIKSINTYKSLVQYKIINTSQDKRETTFIGNIILVMTKEGWKIYYVSEEEIS
jgi:hypothetical protein